MYGRLSPLQSEILDQLANTEPRWTLSGGGALVGFHTAHRVTRDLDFFFHGLSELGEIPGEITRRLGEAGWSVSKLQTAPAFGRLEVRDGDETVVVDLVAEPVPWIEPAVEAAAGILVDTPHEILVNKLACLLSRSEPRDLEDVRVLVAAGENLQRALRDVPRKDGGFSALTLAWLLRTFPLAAAPALGFDQARLEAFRDELLAVLAAPPRPRGGRGDGA